MADAEWLKKLSRAGRRERERGRKKESGEGRERERQREGRREMEREEGGGREGCVFERGEDREGRISGCSLVDTKN